MIDPISMMAISAGVNLAQKAFAPAPATTSALSFQDVMSSSAKSALEKLFASHPEIQDQLGTGPYTLSYNDQNILTLSSSTSGKSITLDPNSSLGQKANLIAQSINLKNIQKGLELDAV